MATSNHGSSRLDSAFFVGVRVRRTLTNTAILTNPMFVKAGFGCLSKAEPFVRLGSLILAKANFGSV